MDFTIHNEKLDQVADLLKTYNLDAWLILVRETSLNPDPALDLVLGLDMTWLSAFIVTKHDERIAIVGRFDVDNVQKMGGFREVIGYDSDMIPHLQEVLKRLDPDSLAVNYSESDAAADGLSYGLWRLLNAALAEMPYKHRVVSAEPLLAALRGRKTASEIQRVRHAIQTTEAIIQAVTAKLAPGQNEVELYDFVREQMESHGVKPAWEPCPIVTAGPDSAFGHTLPDEKHKTVAGQLLHMDLGVIQNGYVSDMQRVWFLKKSGEIPESVQRAFDVVRGAILAAAKVLKPGTPGWEVDQAARSYIVEQGYPEYQHAVGHHIGRSVHDGATVLGPRWPRYGKTAESLVEVDNIFTLELGIHVPDYGYVGLEEDVLVKSDGIEWLSTPQTQLIVVES